MAPERPAGIFIIGFSTWSCLGSQVTSSRALAQRPPSPLQLVGTRWLKSRALQSRVPNAKLCKTVVVHPYLSAMRHAPRSSAFSKWWMSSTCMPCMPTPQCTAHRVA